MKFNDLREFIAHLEERGELARVAAPVNPELEITEITRRVIGAGGPALLFEQPQGFDTPVVINLFGSGRRMAAALGVESLDELAQRIESLLQLAQGPPVGLMNKLRTLGQLASLAAYRPKTVRRAPCQEVVLQGEEVDLYRYPVIKCWPLDGGPFITLPLVITRDPETGVHNYGTYRMQVYDRCTTGMHWQTHKVAAHHQRIGREHGPEMVDSVST